MPDMIRIQTVLTGLTGLPGYNTTYWDSGVSISGVRARLADFWDAAASAVGCGWTYTVATSGDIIDDATGNLTGAWSQSTAHTNGSSGADHAAGVGCQVTLNTVSIAHSHRLRGAIKIVPIASSLYASDGTLDSGVITALNSAYALLVPSVGDLLVWSRPFAGRSAIPVGYRVPRPLPAIAARSGSSSPVTSCTIPDKAVTLATRRR